MGLEAVQSHSGCPCGLKGAWGWVPDSKATSVPAELPKLPAAQWVRVHPTSPSSLPRLSALGCRALWFIRDVSCVLGGAGWRADSPASRNFRPLSYQLSHILVLSQNVKELGRRAKHLLPGEGEMCGCSAGYLRIEVIEILIFQGLHLKRLLVMWAAGLWK